MTRLSANLSLVVALALPSISTAQAANGTWINAASGGLWSSGGNWSSGVIANGTDALADFSTLNITADNTLHLDSARTIGSLIFGDTTPGNNWVLDNNGNAANTLSMTVSAGSPTVTVNNQAAALSLGLLGTGIIKNGSGTLTLSGAVDNTGTGMSVAAGTLILAKTSSAGIHAIGGGGLTISGGTVQLGGTGSDQIYDFANVTLTSGGLDLNGTSEFINTLNLQGSGIGGSGALVNS